MHILLFVEIVANFFCSSCHIVVAIKVIDFSDLVIAVVVVAAAVFFCSWYPLCCGCCFCSFLMSFCCCCFFLPDSESRDSFFFFQVRRRLPLLCARPRQRLQPPRALRSKVPLGLVVLLLRHLQPQRPQPQLGQRPRRQGDRLHGQGAPIHVLVRRGKDDDQVIK